MRCIYCGSELNTGNEIATGLCDRHLSLIAKKDHYIGICWKCNNITLIDEIPRRLKDVFRDKYLFTRECSQCSGILLNDINWITFARFTPDEMAVVTPDGKLARVEGSPPEELKPDMADPVRSQQVTLQSDVDISEHSRIDINDCEDNL